MIEISFRLSIVGDKINSVLVGLLGDVVGADSIVGVSYVPGRKLPFSIVTEYPDPTQDTQQHY